MRRFAPLLGLLVPLVVLTGCSSSSAQPASTLEPSSAAASAPAREYHVTEPHLTAMQEDNYVFTVETDFAEDRPNTELRVEGVAYPLAMRQGTQYVFSHVKVPKLGDNNAKIELPTGPGLPPHILVPFTIHREMTTIDDYRKYATPFDYKQVNKNPDAHKTEYVKGRAHIYQIKEDTLDDGTPYTEGGFEVTNYGYGRWDDNVRFVKAGTTDFVEGDIVSYYGEITGGYSYESEAGWNITTPMIRVDFMEK
jgi:hypothetical protein